MTRTEEIKLVLKDLLYDTKEEVIRNNGFSSDKADLIGASEGVIEKAEELQIYLNELKSLNDDE
jgi:hypothetical protein